MISARRPALLQRRLRRGADRRAVERRSRSPVRPVGLPERRAHGRRRPSGARRGQARSTPSSADRLEKRPRAVDRVDDEKARPVEARRIVRRLLGKPTGLRKRGAKPFGQVAVDGIIRARDRRAAILGVDLGARRACPSENRATRSPRPPRSVGDFVQRREGVGAKQGVDQVKRSSVERALAARAAVVQLWVVRL